MLFSIITVCFNSSKTIRQTFDSVLVQSCKDYEYLVIDGASTDGTVEIIKEYESKFEGRMRWVSEKDNGIYDAMNKGIKMARGEYLNFLNTGDFYEANTLDVVSHYLEKYTQCGLFYGITREVDEKGEFKLLRMHHSRVKNGEMINHQALWYKKKLLVQSGGYKLQYQICADYDNLLTLDEMKCCFCPIDEIVVNYKRGGISDQAFLSGKLNEEKNTILLRHGLLSQKQFDTKMHGYYRELKRLKRKIWVYQVLGMKYWFKYVKFWSKR